MSLASVDTGSSGERSLPPGSRVARYVIVRLIGRGGMGLVYHARDTELERDVALKCPWPERLESGIRRRFLREAKASAALACPYIVPVFEVFEHDRVPWIAMEYVEGCSLREHLQGNGGLPASSLLRYAEHLATALQSAHAKHILHRDIKPANVMINADGRAQLMDFGLARVWSPPHERSQELTEAESITQDRIVGTLQYMSPEQVLGRPLDPRSDIFSLGTVIYEMATARAPFVGSDAGGVIDAILHHEPRPTFGPDGRLPAGFEPILRKALAKEPDERYQDAAELLTDLRNLRRHFEFRRLAAESPTELYDAPLTVGQAPRRPRARWAFELLAGAALLAGGVAITSLTGDDTAPDRHAYRAEPLITWPSAEFDAKLSPNGDWLTFVSDRDGGRAVWIRRLNGHDVTRLTRSDPPVASHLWSPAGDEIVYLVGGDPVTLSIVPAPVPGAVRRTIPIPLEHTIARLVRWVDSRIYVESRGDLWRHDLADGSTVKVLSPGLGYANDLDASERLVLVQGGGDTPGIRLVDLAGGAARSVTDSVTDYHPVFGDSAGKTVLFTSGDTGQTSLWRAALEGPTSERLPLSAASIQATHVEPDGATVLAVTQQVDTDLWRVDPATGRERPVIVDSRNDHGATRAAFGPRLAFQRTDVDRFWLYSGAGSSIVLGEWDGTRIENERVVVEEAYAPAISPDGAWVAYLRNPSPSVHLELWVRAIDTGTDVLVSDRLSTNGFYPSPVEEVSRDYAWGRKRPTLYFVSASDDDVPQIMRFEPGRPVGLVVRPDRAAAGDRIMHLTVSADGRRLAYVLQTSPPVDPDIRPDLRELELATGEDRSVFTDVVSVRPVGWLPGDQALVALRVDTNPDFSQRTTVLEIDRSGVARTLGQHDSAFGWTALLDPLRGRLYVSCEQGPIQDICELSLEDGTWRVLTGNSLTHVAFSALELMDDGTILFTKCRDVSDVWALRATN